MVHSRVPIRASCRRGEVDAEEGLTIPLARDVLRQHRFSRDGPGPPHTRYQYGCATLTSSENRYARELAARYEVEHPLGRGWSWRARRFARGWMSVVPVPSGLYRLGRRLLGRDPNWYLGDRRLVRQRDGITVQLVSNPLLTDPQILFEVLEEIADTASADEIRTLVTSRTVAYATDPFGEGELIEVWWARTRGGAATLEDHRLTDLTAEAEAEDTSASEMPAVVYHCPACAAREFDT